MASANQGGSIYCPNCDYSPTDIVFDKNLGWAGGSVYLSKLSDTTIVLDSWKATNLYSHSSAGSIYVLAEQAFSFEINGNTNGPSYVNNCQSMIHGGACILLYNPTLGGDITMHTESFTADTSDNDSDIGGFFFIFTTNGDVTITQDAFTGNNMSADQAGYLFAKTENGDLCYTCTGICSWTNIDADTQAGAFWLESSDDLCF